MGGQRLMQAASDIFLGWDRVTGIDGRSRDFYVRQLRDWKGIMPADSMVPVGMRRFAVRCGATLARAHARSGDRFAIAGYLGRERSSMRRWRGSRSVTRTRTSAITRHSWRRSGTAGSPPTRAEPAGGTAAARGGRCRRHPFGAPGIARDVRSVRPA